MTGDRSGDHGDIPAARSDQEPEDAKKNMQLIASSASNEQPELQKLANGSQVANQPSNPAGPKLSLFVCVGEISADRHAARVIRKLKEAADIDCWGVGGNSMQESGARLLYHIESFSVLGILEVLKYLPRLARMRTDLLCQIERNKPDAVLLMDYGGFNIGFATSLRKRMKDIPIIYFISPQVWGSRPWRINAIAGAITRMLVIFPFEEDLYRRKGVSATFVGHPLTTRFKGEQPEMSRQDFCRRHDLDPNRPIIGVFPGSRTGEIVNHAPVIFRAIDWLSKERPEVQFVLSCTNSSFADALYAQLDKLGYNRLVGRTLKTVQSEENEELMRHAEILWTKSGTTTLEAALIGKPMLIFYRGNWISFIIFLMFKTVKNVGWPNLLAGYELVPELIQLDCRADKLVRYTLDWLDVPALRAEISRRLKECRMRLGEGDFTDNAAAEILKVLGVTTVPSESKP